MVDDVPWDKTRREDTRTWRSEVLYLFELSHIVNTPNQVAIYTKQECTDLSSEAT